MTVYRGRFAPSPTGPLHFGSLFAAVVSYLEARTHNGQWLVRIEDIDPLREQARAALDIIQTLHAHSLIPDEAPIFQSTRYTLYEQTLQTLLAHHDAYSCPCSRKYLKEHHGIHQTECIQQRTSYDTCALKFKAPKFVEYAWEDAFQGWQSRVLHDDFVLRRKEGFYAYQLAVVCDDIDQNISHVVRGFDLIDSTPMQLALYQALKVPSPKFLHFPVIIQSNGQKLSKQNLAPAVNKDVALSNLLNIFDIMGLKLKYKPDTCKSALSEALECWNTDFLIAKSELIQDKGL